MNPGNARNTTGDFEHVDIGDPNLPTAGMLAYILANRQNLRISGAKDNEKNITALEAICGAQYHILRHLQRETQKRFGVLYHNKDKISQTKTKDRNDYTVRDIIGGLAMIALGDSDQMDEVLNPDFKIHFSRGKLELDGDEYKIVMRGLMAVAPADNLSAFYNLCLDMSQTPGLSSELRSRINWFHDQLINAIEDRSKQPLHRDDLLSKVIKGIERLDVYAAISAIRMNEWKILAFDPIPVAKTSIHEIQGNVDRIFDQHESQIPEFRRLLETPILPKPKPGRIKNPFDLIQAITLGEKSLVPSR